MMESSRGKDFLFNNNCGFDNREDGEGYIYSDGSGYFHGNDGSEGYIYSDGSAYFHGADGSDGYKYSDGSGYFHGADGSDGYKYSDGSGYYNSANGEMESFYADSDGGDDDMDSSNPGDLSDALANLLGIAIGVGIAAYSGKRQRKREEDAEYERFQCKKEAERKEEAERVHFEKEKEREAKNILRKKRVKAFLFKGKKIEMPFDCQDLIGKDVSLVSSMIGDAAFSNIKVIPVKDIFKDSIYYVGQVEKISISGSLHFREGDWIPYDAEIIISYHDKKEITIPFSERSLRKMDYITAGDRLQELGFTEIYEKPICDLVTGWIKKNGTVEKVMIGDVYPFKKNSAFPYDVIITIEYHTFKKS